MIAARWLGLPPDAGRYFYCRPASVGVLAFEHKNRDTEEENVFLFGLTAEQVAGSRGWYDPRRHYEHEEETRQALDLIFSGDFNRKEPGLYDPIRETLLTRGDYYMHLADLASYSATQSHMSGLYAERGEWGRKAIVNVGLSGKFSSDRTIAEYAGSIWGAVAVPRPIVEETDHAVTQAKNAEDAGLDRPGGRLGIAATRVARRGSRRNGSRRPRWSRSSRPAG